MKKSLFLGAMASMMLLSTSCQEELPVVEPGGEAVVSFNLSTPQLATRAYSKGLQIDNLKYAVYDHNKEIIADLSATDKGIEFDGSETLKMQLTNGSTYTIIFWASHTASYNETTPSPYSIDWSEKKLTVNYKGASNDDKRDAFFEDVTFKVEGSQPVDVTLTRPFAQLNIGTNDLKQSATAQYEVTHTAVLANANVPTKFNLLGDSDGNHAVSDFVNVEFALSPMPKGETFPVEGYDYLAMNYVLANDVQETLIPIVTLQYKNGESSTDVRKREFGQVPVRRNYRTNIYGSLLTNGVDVNVDINPDYYEPDNNKLPECFITNLRTGEVYNSFAEAYRNSVNGDELLLSAGVCDLGVHGINGRSLKIYGPNKGVPANGNRRPEAVIVGNVYQPSTAISATNKFEVEFDGVEMAENFYVEVEGGITNLTIKNSIVKSTTAKIANKENRIVYIHAKYRPSTVVLENNLFEGKGTGDDRLEIWMYGDKGDKLGIGSSVNAIIRNNVFDNTVLNLGGDMTKSSFTLYNNTYLNDAEYWLNGVEKEETSVVINLTKNVTYTTFADAYKDASNGDELELSAGKFDLGVHGINGRSLKIYGPNKGVPANGNRRPEAVIVGNVYQPWTAITATNKFEVEFDGVEMAENFYVEVEGGITNLTIKNSIVKSTTAKIANTENRIVYIHAKSRPSTVVLENNLFEGKGTGADRLEIWMYGDKGDKLGIGSSVTATIKNNVFDNTVLNLGGDLTKSSFDLSGNTYQNNSEYWMNGALQENK